MHTEVALTAKAIRAELKKAFPKTKFSVRSDNFTGGDSVRIEWTHGASQPSVNLIVDKYQYGHFDGMNDIYEDSNRRDDIPQTKFLFTDRLIEENLMQQAFEDLQAIFPALENVKSLQEYVPEFDRSAHSLVRKGFFNYDLSDGYCSKQYRDYIVNR